ncbi:hypothetical protein PAPYR_6857 [Paratrimastix pyriformis]|uniref:Phosphatidic acid phosphatase type 2/haloperoxidase domain-containing protein n=1 Tax=Paratrimastix pyriformis TaxID=342808 RepID=A0ABQ8UEA6_9EUKA|nr:hypothetical protein PAPYR_6857 [Paratrimastix pyriformis]
MRSPALWWVPVVVFLTLPLLPFIWNENVVPAIRLLLFHQVSHPPKAYPPECLARTSQFALTYCSGGHNFFFAPLSSLFMDVVRIVSQAASFSLRALPYAGVAISIASLFRTPPRLAWCALVVSAFALARAVWLLLVDTPTVDHLNCLAFTAVLFLAQLLHRVIAAISPGTSLHSPLNGVFVYVISHTSGHVATYLKGIIRQPRPQSYWPPHTVQCAHSWGMPSEHAMICAAWLCQLLWCVAPSRAQKGPRVPKWVLHSHLLWFGVAVPLSRLLLGYHTPLQVLAGAGCGVALWGLLWGMNAGLCWVMRAVGFRAE